MSPPSVTDQEYLLQDQYRDAANLDARIQVHKRFSTNEYGWFPWLFEKLDLPGECQILELGCGPGVLWRQNRARIPAGWEITLSDFSEGMVDQARQNLGDGFVYEIIDAQAIPCDDDTFDAILACHMLYHVPDRPQALAEMLRVLRAGGRLYITTIGEDHLCEMGELVARFDPGIKAERDTGFLAFTLENGAAQLGAHFSETTLHRYEDGLRVTEAAPLADSILSSTWYGVAAERRAELVAFIDGELAANDDVIQITKDTGLFVARNA